MSRDSSPQLIVIGNDVASTVIVQAAISQGFSVLSLRTPGLEQGLGGGLLEHTEQPAPSWMKDPALVSDRNMKVLSTAGTIHHASLKLRSVLDLASLKDKSIGVVAVDAGAEWDAEFALKSLREAGFSNARLIDISAQVEATSSLLEFARWTDREASVDVLAGALLNEPRCDAYLFASVLGLAKLDIAEKLSSRLDGALVGECCGTADSPPGRRLSRVFSQWISPSTQRASAPKVETEPRLKVTNGTNVWYPQAVVVATGSLATGGIEFDKHFVEPITDAPLFETLSNGTRVLVSGSAERGMDPGPLFAPSFDGSIRAANVGLIVDADGRILSLDTHSPMHSALFALGTLVSGFRNGFLDSSAPDWKAAERLAVRLIKDLRAATSEAGATVGTGGTSGTSATT